MYNLDPVVKPRDDTEF
ncbi:MAG TPA: palindromic element RPE4 domain-containing protein [Candidatus Enterousia intestinigallinarum]|uniref:Palindromic element RPE4 domain-containing protein n=1 Tax=Candidatus Enterousia intestinigallinarum TaxID=2840790 RepID=A0A9D1FGN6_9PROT|nr:palindromic element RPE4 domain-containing protein [Candidatus Enterousia intestinigallinarum]